MKINIYYGGRGLIDDPTLYVINKMQKVLEEELYVKVERFMLYELKNSITTLPQTLKDADGIILATTVEWYGIGGYMMQFLDACWLYADKEKLSRIYMAPVVMSTTYGEREGKLNLSAAWEILGGRPCSGLCGYIANTAALEMNDDYSALIEKKAETIYRTIDKKMASLPASNQAVKQRVSVSQNTDLTPQESERLSQYVSDDIYVQKQKEDIQELANMFRGMMGNEPTATERYIRQFKEKFSPIDGFKGTYKFVIGGKAIGMRISDELNITEEPSGKFDVEVSLTEDTMNDITAGHITFQRAFMSGNMKTKGEFGMFRTLDELFTFMK
ncbi:MAG: SCP2 sterol-binding domain-containing protein [Lachnospiraceae bacterium]|nr:SCP2 sterol-binding domain-containing protein [Lachnospiraceae bacterium]